MIDSAAECRNNNISNTTERIKSIRKWLKRKDAATGKIKSNGKLSAFEKQNKITSIRSQMHGKKRKLHAFEEKLRRLKEDKRDGKTRICFGGKELFYKQFALGENDYAFHGEWLSDWQDARSSGFYFLGSHEERGGNQSCTLSVEGSLRIRVPNALSAKYGKYVTAQVSYPYGSEVVMGALLSGAALTHRFVKKEGTWYLHTSVEMPKGKNVSQHSRDIGCIAVDVNVKEIAVAETDRFGNYVESKTYAACVKDRSEDQTKAIYGDICKEIIDRCVSTGKPLAHETLDFQRKKASLKEQGTTYARMLSQFAYSLFLAMIDTRAYKQGVLVFTDNPAYTSVIGKVNYMARYGITPHEAAAIAIARRIQGYSELPDPSRTAISLPVRNRGMHVWNVWRKVKGSGACDQHHRLFERRSLQDSTAGGKTGPPSSKPPQLITEVSTW